MRSEPFFICDDSTLRTDINYGILYIIYFKTKCITIQFRRHPVMLSSCYFEKKKTYYVFIHRRDVEAYR